MMHVYKLYTECANDLGSFGTQFTSGSYALELVIVQAASTS